MAARPMGKTRSADQPWLTVVNGTWTWKVLQAHVNDPDKPYASWFCQVITPMTGASGDWGDTYIADVRGTVVQRDPSVPDSALPSWLRS